MGDSESLNRFLDATSVTAKYGKLSEYPDVVLKSLDERVTHIIESPNHELYYEGQSIGFNIVDMSEDELQDQILECSRILNEIYKDVDENRNLILKAGEFRESIADLEVGLAIFVFSGED